MSPRLLPVLLLLLLSCQSVIAEPFLAIQNGYQCSQCHINPTGAGMRNSFGAAFSRSLLPSRTLTIDKRLASLTGSPFGIGADVRAAGQEFDVPGQDDNFGFAINRATVYLTATPTDSMRLYLDEEVSRDKSENRETWAQYSLGNFYVKAGRFFLPYGMRILDDSAFTRLFTGVQFGRPDTGIEFGHVDEHLSGQLSITNGTGGGDEVDNGKMVSTRLAWVKASWRAGVSAARNDTSMTDRTMYGVFGGLRTGPVSWLAEYDRVKDSPPALPNQERDVGYIEADWMLFRGNYLRLASQLSRSPTDSYADANRYGIEYIWFPAPMTEIRFGTSISDSMDTDPFMKANNYFVELHFYL